MRREGPARRALPRASEAVREGQALLPSVAVNHSLWKRTPCVIKTLYILLYIWLYMYRHVYSLLVITVREVTRPCMMRTLPRRLLRRRQLVCFA